MLLLLEFYHGHQLIASFVLTFVISILCKVEYFLLPICLFTPVWTHGILFNSVGSNLLPSSFISMLTWSLVQPLQTGFVSSLCHIPIIL